jgi:hypothetical protein
MWKEKKKMTISPSGPIRRAQLITPFGVGAMVVVPGGTSLLVGGLDYWYKDKDGKGNIDLQEFMFEEWRLQTILGVSHFRLPPDHREMVWGQKVPNLGITIPAFRFPTWHFCSDKSCRLLYSWPMYTRGKWGRIKCPECEKKKKTRYMFQVPFVAMCERGHVQDFPWREWVHREANPTCDGMLRLLSTGSATLAGQKVKCTKCGRERSLLGITSATPAGETTLSNSLVDGIEYLCRGEKPWLGPGSEEYCGAHLRGSLRSASNLYFSHILSSIYLPRVKDVDSQKIETLLESPPLSTLLSILRNLGQNQPTEIVKALKSQHQRLLVEYSDDQITTVITQLYGQDSFDSQQGQLNNISEDARTAFRRAEYSALRTERNDLWLKIKQGDKGLFDHDIGKFFSQIMLISKLRETRVFD